MLDAILHSTYTIYVLLPVILILAVLSIGLYILSKPSPNEVAPPTNSEPSWIRAGSWETAAWLLGGAVFAFVVAALVWVVAIYLLTWFLPIQGAISSLAHAFGSLLGVYIGYFYIFAPGIKTIKPGERAYLTIIGFPFGNLGPGNVWIYPWAMGLHITNAAFRHEGDTGTSEYVTGNGIEILIDSGSTYGVKDWLLAESIVGTSVAEFVASTRRAAVRAFVSEKSFDLTESPDDDTGAAQTQIVTLIKGMKGDIADSGPILVTEKMNQILNVRGIEITQVQFRRVLLDDTLEKAAQRYYAERLERAGLLQNAKNQIEGMNLRFNNMLNMAGLPKDTLSEERRFDMINLAGAQTQAAEDELVLQHLQVGGKSTQGVFVNTTAPTPTKGD